MNTREEQERIEWVTMNMRLSGSSADEERAARIAAGAYVLDASLEDHILVNRLLCTLDLMRDLADRQEELCTGILDQFYSAISGGTDPRYRKRTPVLFHLSYHPVLPQEIEAGLAEVFRKLHRHAVYDPLERAVWVHNEIIRIYPYDDCNETVARAAMEYELLYNGKPMYPLLMTETEYNSALAAYLNGRECDLILENLRCSKLMTENCRDWNLAGNAPDTK